MVRQVPRCLGCRHVAPTVEHLFFLGTGVVNARKDADVFTKDAGQFAGGGLAFGAVLLGQVVEGCLKALCFTIDLESEARDGFIKEPLPGVAHDAEIMEELFQLVGQLVGLHGADAIEDGLVACEGVVLGQHGGQSVIF